MSSINTDMNDLTREMEDLLRYLLVKLPTTIPTERTKAEIRQTIYHTLERAYLAGFDAAASVATEESKKT